MVLGEEVSVAQKLARWDEDDEMVRSTERVQVTDY